MFSLNSISGWERVSGIEGASFLTNRLREFNAVVRPAGRSPPISTVALTSASSSEQTSVVALQHLASMLEVAGVKASIPSERPVMPHNHSKRSFSARRLAAVPLAVCLIAAFGVRQVPAAPFVYVLESGALPESGAVAVIDAATNAVVATISDADPARSIRTVPSVLALR
jgi:DNA-binding beta-propeller fold protein YncE